MADRFLSIYIEKEPDFWRLIWQSVDLTRFLTPVGKCRTLRCVVDRLKPYNVSLEELAQPKARCDITRNTDWFVPCMQLAQDFDWDRFESLGSIQQAIRVRAPNPIERSECPDGTWYIKEGVHRTLVAAVLLDQKKISWRPFSVLRLEPA
jgi:hypothetical protein